MSPVSSLPDARTKKVKNKKIIFNDDGEASIASENVIRNREKSLQKQTSKDDEGADRQKWFNNYPEFPSSSEETDMKDTDQMELYNLCKSSFEAELQYFSKRNPSDSRWLQTALHKGTAKDRANAGALLVTSNPLGNLPALETLISYTKLSNKSAPDVISVLTTLWKEILLPPHRALYSIRMRAADWKIVRKDEKLSKENKRRIYAYWHFENELKDQYSEFLKNLQQSLQSGQENNKCSAIISASSLLAYAPEKEQLLLSMLINKLGDPLAKVASKALHHLSEVAHQHPNMCGVITNETEKLLFRNNISDRAQHFALCFLSSIAFNGCAEVCTKLVNICFGLFKVLVQKGAVNSRTMQAILRCLQKAIVDAKPLKGNDEIMDAQMQDTIYRLIHLADIRISIQTLSLLLQLVAARAIAKTERFYNALYKKMIDLEVTEIGTKSSAQLLHIIHRAIHIDGNINRAKAFIKRLLQLALHAPAQMAAGCLIIVQKLLHSRNELRSNQMEKIENFASSQQVNADDDELMKFDSDGEEKYKDIVEPDEKEEKKEEDEQLLSTTDAVAKPEQVVIPSWHHAKNTLNPAQNNKVKDISASKYDPYHRVPAYAGAEFIQQNELLLLSDHFHPSVKLFADNILNEKRIDYYGDPLKDFALPHFLERFAFKNPKKFDKNKAGTPIIEKKLYRAFGSRGKPVTSLTKSSYTEDEYFIFNYLDRKRQLSGKTKPSDSKKEDDDEDEMKFGDVDDDEFETFLDGYFGKKGKKKGASGDDDDDDDGIDFLNDIDEKKVKGSSSRKEKKKKGGDETAAKKEEEDEGEVDVDWSEDDQPNDVGSSDEDAIDDSNDDESDSAMMPMDESESEDSGGDMSEDEFAETSKSNGRKSKQLQQLNEKNFTKTLKHSTDMSSLFAAADDFAELLEEAGKAKGQGTSNAVYNKDKSSLKQIKWEENRRSTIGRNKRKKVEKNFAKKKKKF